MKKKIGIILAFLLIFLSFNFSSDIIYLTELVSTIYKIQRTEADITDYKYFDNIEIPKSNTPQAWPVHKNYNQTNLTDKLNKKNKKYSNEEVKLIRGHLYKMALLIDEVKDKHND